MPASDPGLDGDHKNAATTKNALTTQQQADIILNRANVALARSKRLIQSWLPPRENPISHNGESPVANDEQSSDDEEFFKGMTEIGGIGSKNAYSTDDQAHSSGVLSGRKGAKRGADDRLLEQLIGKKAAAARRKEKEKESRQGLLAKKNIGAVNKSQAKSANPGLLEGKDGDSGDEEEGRVARFSSKKSKSSANSSKNSGALDVSLDEVRDVVSSKHEDDDRPRGKRKATSYLDELLATKSKKKKKKSKT